MRLAMATMAMLLSGCPGRECEDCGGTESTSDATGTSIAGSDEVVTAGETPPEMICGPVVTDPFVACGVVCIDALGVNVVVLCQLGGGWECRFYPRSGPIVGEVYDELPVWCGGDGVAEDEEQASLELLDTWRAAGDLNR